MRLIVLLTLISTQTFGQWIGSDEIDTTSVVDNSLSWILNYENLLDIKIEGNKFSSNKTSGEFVTYDNGTEKIKGLKIVNPWSGIPESGQWEIGLRRGNPNDFLSGKFIQASLRQLEKNELVKLDNPELKLMRNEIFARYGLKFKTGGEMDSYFTKQTWYRRQHDNVDKFLTDVEKENIKIIQEVESR
jgi:hypothetical protein